MFLNLKKINLNTRAVHELADTPELGGENTVPGAPRAAVRRAAAESQVTAEAPRHGWLEHSL